MGLAHHLIQIKIWDKPEIKKVFFPTRTIRTTSGPSNLIGTRTGDSSNVTKNVRKEGGG